MTDWLTKLVREAGRDPARADVLGALWRADYPNAKSGDIEHSIDTALHDLAEAAENIGSSPSLRRVMSLLKQPALVVQRDGIVHDVNDACRKALDAGFGDHVDHLGIRPLAEESLHAVIAAILDGPPGSDFRILQAVSDESDRPSVLAVIRPAGLPDKAVVFVIDPQISREMAQAIGRAHGLTEAEAEILEAFLKGTTLQSVADLRGRSLATVRTQFNTILAKFGVPSQAALVRLVFGISSFLTEIEDARPIFDHPNRRKFALPRPHGRTVEFFLEGDETGRVIVHPSDVLCYTFNAKTELLLKQAGLCMLSIARPGVGGTDPAPKGMAIEDCAVEDANAVVQLLQAEECITFSSGLTAPYAIYLGANLSTNVRSVVLNTPLVPPAFFRSDQGETIPIMFALMRAERFSPRLVRFLLRSAEAHIKRIGIKRFIASQFAKIPSDRDAALRPENLRELENSVNAQYILGRQRDETDMLIVMRDWTPWIQGCDAPISIVHGPENPVMSPRVYGRFQEKFPNSVRLAPIQGAAAAPGMTHAAELVQIMSDAFDA